MNKLLDRFLKYVAFDTQSSDRTGEHPSTAKQFALAQYLVEELKSLGVEDVILTSKCYIYAKLPASPGCEHIPPLGFIAHLDTSDAASSRNVKPQIIPDWNGEPIALGSSGIELHPLEQLQGHTLITTDGTTLLGADDKAGIAVIMTAVEQLLQQSPQQHGPLRIAFTPDEEIGEGTAFFDADYFDADYAYTVDSTEVELVESENFNAARADISIRGVATHPGYAFGVMRNALTMAMEFNAMLPADEVPEKTRDRQGFYHLINLTGTASAANMSYLVRDHDRQRFEERKNFLQQLVEQLNRQYSSNTFSINIKDQYFNMAEVINCYPFLLEKARAAIRAQGLTPANPPIRGGTDGAQLARKGLPCPNLSYGAYNPHSELEYADLENMQKACRILLHIIDSFITEPPHRRR